MTFDQIIGLGLTGIERLVIEQTEETHTLEFKSKHNPGELDLHKDDRRALGEALSGFANAIGGILIVGIKTAKSGGLDRAAQLCRISNVQQVADRYRAYTSECVTPVVDGIRVEAISDDSGNGVVVVGVPKGSARPHMSMAPGHQRYYRRVADAFVPMLHYEVDEMMRVKTAPRLSLIYQVKNNGSIGENRQFVIPFGLKNSSAVTAKFPYITYLGGQNLPRVARYGLDGNGRTLWPNMSIGAQPNSVFAAGADQVIHPGQEFFVSMLEFDEVCEPSFSRGWALSRLDGALLTLVFEFGCEDCPMERVEIVLKRDEILAA